MRVRFFGKISISHLGNLNGKNILEAGCGTGESLVNITRKAKKLTGLDISKSILELTRKNFEKHNIKKEKYCLVVGDIQNMPFRDEFFDLTFNSGVIEHFDDDEINNQPVKEMIRVTKKGGKIIILVPSVYSWYYLYYLISRIPFFNGIYAWDSHRFYSLGMMHKQLKELNVNYKIKLCYKSLFVYLVAEINC